MADVYGKKKFFLCIFVNEIFSTRKKKYLADVYGLKISVFVYICQEKVFYT